MFGFNKYPNHSILQALLQSHFRCYEYVYIIPSRWHFMIYNNQILSRKKQTVVGKVYVYDVMVCLGLLYIFGRE